MEARRILHVGIPWIPGRLPRPPPRLPNFPRFISASSIQRFTVKSRFVDTWFGCDQCIAGLVWVSILPKSIILVEPQGVECQVIYSDLPESVISEILWTCESFSTVTCCRSLVIVYDCQCIVQIGVAAKSSKDGEPFHVDGAKLMQGSLCQNVSKSGAQSYLANLSLYPGRSELPFMPSNTQVSWDYMFLGTEGRGYPASGP